MGAVDVDRQALNVFRMRLLGSEVEAVHSGSRTLKDAVNEALRDWVATVGDTHYCLGSVMGPHPYPWMVREFHRVIGDEAREQCRAPDRRRSRRRRRLRRRRLERDRASSPGSSTPTARLVGVEPAGGAAVGRGVPGVVHGMRSYLMQDEYGQVRRRSRSPPASTTRASAPSTRTWRRSAAPSTRRSPTPRSSTRSSCWPAPRASSPRSSRAHAMAWIVREARTLQGQTVLMNLSGRGDKDVAQMMDILGDAGRDGGARIETGRWSSVPRQARRGPQAAGAVHHRRLPGLGGRRPGRRGERRRRASRSASRSPIR